MLSDECVSLVECNKERLKRWSGRLRVGYKRHARPHAGVLVYTFNDATDQFRLLTTGWPLQLTIEKLIYGGDGLARLPADEHGRGKTVFVPFVLPGEQVEASVVEGRPGFARAQLERVITPSTERVEPGCPYFTRCGGCHYQHIDYAAQLRYKSEILRETLRRTAKFELQARDCCALSRAVGLSQSHPDACGASAGICPGIFSVRLARAAAGGELPHQLAADQPRHHGCVDDRPPQEGCARSPARAAVLRNHDDTKLLVELYVRPESGSPRSSAAASKAASTELSAAAGTSLDGGANAKAMQTFAAQLA